MSEQEQSQIENVINQAFEIRQTLTPATKGEVYEAVTRALTWLCEGQVRVAERQDDGSWQVNEWLKKAVLLSFRLNEMRQMPGGPDSTHWWDKVAMKCSHWDREQFEQAAFRAVPGSLVRHGAYIGKNVVLMPSFVNIGAYVDAGTMVDTWATVGSCAQIGKNVHLSGGVGIGGVLEPLQAGPTIIEDNCFIGARSEVVEGCIVREGSVLGMGVFIGQSTRIVDRDSGEVFYGEVPAYSVVVAGSMPGSKGNGALTPNLYCAVIVKRVDERTRAKTSINELLRS